MDAVWFWALAVLAAALVGASKGGVPVVGMLSVPLMALVMNPVMAAGLLLPVYVVSDLFGLYAYRRAYDARVLVLVLPGAVFAGTTTVAFAVINAVKLVPYAALGQLGLANLKVATVLAMPAAAAVFLGVWLVKVMPEVLFFRLVTWALALISVKLVWDGVTGF